MTTTKRRRTADLPTARELVNQLPASYDHAIAAAMENAYDMGLREDAADDGAAYWAEVHGQVTA